jgi:hypothetical protein
MADTIQVDQLAEALAKSFDMRDAAEGKVRESRKPSLVSPFNPNGDAKRPKLRCETLFCGAIQQEESLKNEEIELFNSLRAGRYNGGKWTVLASEDATGHQRLDVRVPVNDINALMDLPNSLVGILKQIATEAEATASRKTTK